MTKRSRSTTIITARLERLPVRDAVGLDRRSIRRAQMLIKELSDFPAKDIAAQINISTQKYAALRHLIRRSKVASPRLNTLLEDTLRSIRIEQDKPRAKRGYYISEAAIHGKRKFRIDYVLAGRDYTERELPHAKNIKPGGFASLQSVLNWYGAVAGGKDYFWIIYDRNTDKYYIYDIRTSKERNQRGRVGKPQAAKKIEKGRKKGGRKKGGRKKGGRRKGGRKK